VRWHFRVSVVALDPLLDINVIVLSHVSVLSNLAGRRTIIGAAPNVSTCCAPQKTTCLNLITGGLLRPIQPEENKFLKKIPNRLMSPASLFRCAWSGASFSAAYSCETLGMFATTPLRAALGLGSVGMLVVGWWWAKHSFVATNADPWWYSTWVVALIFGVGAVFGFVGRPRAVTFVFALANLCSAALFAPWPF
jgi:hypothetical protein